MSADLVIENCTIVTPRGRQGGGCGVAVRDGKIASIGSDDHLPRADETIDAGGNYLVPGIIDSHIHNREPGLEYKEDWETATRAAAAGGVTSVVGMPQNDPPIDHPDHIELKFELGDEKAIVDFQTYAVIHPDNLDGIAAMNRAGPLGFKSFLGPTIGSIKPPSDGEMIEAMKDVAETGKRLGFHEENDEIVNYYTEKFQKEGKNRPIDHSHSRPVVAETEAVARMTHFASVTGAKVHMFHVSSGSAAEIVAEQREKGVDVTAETTPQYLWFTEEVMEEKGNVARIQPPIRDREEQDRLWAEVLDDDGGIDCITTDHSPHTDEEKGMDDPFQNTWDVISGFVGLESEVPAMLTFVDQGRFSLEEWVTLHSTRPAQVWNMYPEKGSLQVGTDADFTIVDPEREWTLDRHNLHSKNTVTPFDGETFTGAVETTVVRGNVVYDDGEVVGTPGTGELIDVDSDSFANADSSPFANGRQ